MPSRPSVNGRLSSIGAVRKCSSISMRAVEELLEAIEADGNGDRQADRRPQRVAAADPVPEHEHVRRVDAEAAHLRLVGRDGHEVLRDVRLVCRGGEEPRARRAPVHHRLFGREGLRRDDEQRRLRAQAAQRLERDATRRRSRRSAGAGPRARTASAPAVAITGPRSDPPMPMLTTSVMRWPV